MYSSSCHLIGVEIGVETIRLCCFDLSGNPYSISQLELPRPAMPGAVTVALCDKIELIDPDCRADLVGVGLPGVIDITGRTVTSCPMLPGWFDVPLSDWLEPRLSRKVFLNNSIKCSKAGKNCQAKIKYSDHNIFMTRGAALLALRDSKVL
ncbi:ROK family protein [Prochlorococcus sp. MIT 1307]|uniref:ROK family protein n=1 Tax=Prochlorococcus sp. MIT 1307 TaxID=3096219 RepID=UPI002A75943B|nr:ROK family protein [Prochlorococcus sp. MIT 1307]